ncbi:MAG TPA: efflux RND transporter periplasmic adaptor subunit [Verrucomicrobiae bacterium]
MLALTISHPVQAADAPPLSKVTVANPIPKEIDEWDEFTGRLASVETVEVRARVSGFLEKVHFQEGADVKAGDLLFSLDARPFQAVVDRLEAELSRAKTRAELSRIEAKNADSLFKSRAISQEEYEQRTKQATESDQNVKAAEAAVRAAKLDLEFSEVRAPISGRISNARVTSGNLVVGGGSSGSVLTTIVSLDPIYCYIEVDERSSLKYRELYRQGKRESALFKKIPARMGLATDTTFPHIGTVDFVDNQLNPNTGTIRARCVFPNVDKLMAPGFFARVQIPGSGTYQGMMIRDAAIGNDQGRSYVMLVDSKNTVVYRPVKAGPIIDGMRVVREGLKPDDKVIVNGMMAVRSGQQVTTEMSEMQPASGTNSSNGAQ